MVVVKEALPPGIALINYEDFYTCIGDYFQREMSGSMRINQKYQHNIDAPMDLQFFSLIL